MSPKEVKKFERKRRVAERLIPTIRRANKAQFEDTKQVHKEGLKKTSGTLVRKLEAQGLKPGQTANLHYARDKRFSDIDAHVTLGSSTTEKGETVKKAQWSLHALNEHSETSSVLYLETNHSVDAEAEISKLEMIDPTTGAAYGPDAYKLPERARLYQTAEYAMSELNFAMLAVGQENPDLIIQFP